MSGPYRIFPVMVALVALTMSGCIAQDDASSWSLDASAARGVSYLSELEYALPVNSSIRDVDGSFVKALKIQALSTRGETVWLHADTYRIIARGEVPIQYVHATDFGIDSPSNLMQFLPWQFAGKTLEPGPIIIQGIEMNLSLEHNKIILKTTNEGAPFFIRFSPSDSIWPSKVEVKGAGSWSLEWTLQELSGGFEELPGAGNGVKLVPTEFSNHQNIVNSDSYGAPLDTVITLLEYEDPEFSSFVSNHPDWILIDAVAIDLEPNPIANRMEWRFTIGEGRTSWAAVAVVQYSEVSDLFTRIESHVGSEHESFEVPGKFDSLSLGELEGRCDSLLGNATVRFLLGPGARGAEEFGGHQRIFPNPVGACYVPDHSSGQSVLFLSAVDGSLLSSTSFEFVS